MVRAPKHFPDWKGLGMQCSTYKESATVRAANPFAQVRGPTPASNTSSTSAPHVPQSAEGISPEADPPLGRATAKRGRAQPAQARQRPAAARGLGRPHAAGAPNIVAPCSTPMTTPRMPMSLAHPGIHKISSQARRQRSREPKGGHVRTRRKAAIPLEKARAPRQAYG